ncbi:MAG: aminoacyl-tRNA hydrolase [Candidatus Electrothrix sp. AW5]|nr:aminoacyl-tRNA hydrolase [Candidatus Electrothrix sp. AX1]MCI5183245.1 aminoacyl-tRNA hydrolase [Candidatus Electrothrix gigas]MCI5195236.1 aminoacyl-tRNA hydrolase [Candidatus Electrothrix gigas]
MADSYHLIVGLGNPGTQYELTRHNAGFLAVDDYADQQNCSLDKEKWNGQYTSERINGQRVILLKPQTFMNKSGESVIRYVDFYQIPLENILIISDDLDLSQGKIKVTAKGGAGGHNGIRSLIQHLGTSTFARLKIGIGRPERDEQGRGVPVDRYVLNTFTDKELALFNDRLRLIHEAIDLFLEQGVDKCMNRINGRKQQEQQE